MTPLRPRTNYIRSVSLNEAEETRWQAYVAQHPDVKFSRLVKALLAAWMEGTQGKGRAEG